MDAESIETQLESLHRERGRLALAGKDPSKITAEIMRLHQEQATLLDIANAKEAQSREQAAKQYDLEVSKLESDIAAHNENSGRAWAAAQAKLKEFADLMRLRYQHNESARKLVGKRNGMTGDNVSAPNNQQLQK